MGNYTSTKSLNKFKSLIQCGVKQNNIINNFTLVAHYSLPSRDLYDFYLTYFQNDTDLQYKNQINNEKIFCQKSKT